MAEKFSRTSLAKYIVSSDKNEEILSREVAAFLISVGKTSDLDSLLRDVMEIRAKEEGIIELSARSANPLSQEIKSEIESVAGGIYPEAREVIIHEIHDPSVIGGVRLQFANASLDLTIQSKLNKLREAIA